jgi:MATE family multidrug resistance protein
VAHDHDVVRNVESSTRVEGLSFVTVGATFRGPLARDHAMQPSRHPPIDAGASTRRRLIVGEVGRLFALGGPVAATQVGLMMLGVVDTLMVSQLGVASLDAAALGNLWVYGTMMIAMGVVFGLDPIVSQAHGAGDESRVGLSLQQGLVTALWLSVPVALSWLVTAPALRLLGQDPKLAAMAHDYVLVQLPSIPFFLAYAVQRSWLQGRGFVWPALGVAILANGVNAAGNYLLIHGVSLHDVTSFWHVPALGLVGAGIATSITRVFVCLGIAAWIVLGRLHRGGWLGWSREALSWAGQRAILATGVPVAAQYGLEMWAFQFGMIMAGWIGEDELGAHTIALNLASLSFMLPFGLSIGAATRVGNLIGAARPADAQRSAEIALGLGGAVMVLSAITFVLFRHELPALYADAAVVLSIAAALLPVAGAFQIFDGVQVVGGAILRGMGDSRPAAWANLVGYYALGLPLGYLLAFHFGFGVVGIWWGFATGLFVVATALVVWVIFRGPAYRFRDPASLETVASLPLGGH